MKFECNREISNKKGIYIYIIVKGKLENEEVTLVNVSTYSEKSSYKTLLDSIILETEELLICGGDFNIVMNSSLDTTNQKKNHNIVTKTVNNLFKEFGIIDIWRELHPTRKDYTHYSAPNKSDARTDRHKNRHTQCYGM